MKNEDYEGGNESLDAYKESRNTYKQQVATWGQELVDRAIEADLSGEDCAKIEKLVASAVVAGIEAFPVPSSGLLPWTQPIFERTVERWARASSPADAELVQKVLALGETTLPIVTPEEAAAIPAPHVSPMETAVSTEASVPVSTTAPVSVEHVFHAFDRAKWSNAENSPEETYSKYSEQVQRIAEKKIAELSSGASSEAVSSIRAVIEGLRDHVIDAAKSEGPIPFEQRLKYDKGVLALSSRRTTTAAQAPVASPQQNTRGEEKAPIKSFDDLAAMREALLVARGAEEQKANVVIEQTSAPTHRSATHEPPETITEVSAEVPVATPQESVAPAPEGGQEKAAVERLNALKALIDAEHEIIRATREENKRDASSGKKITDARWRLGELHQESKVLAAGLVGGSALVTVVKPVDDAASRLYESQIPRKTAKDERRKLESTLPEGAVDAYYEAVRRKNAFADMLVQKGVAKDAAYDLYREFVHQAQELEILKDVLLRGEENAEDVLSTGRAQKVLEWHGLTAHDPQAVLAALTTLVDLYNTIPPKVERATKNIPRERLSPMAVLSQLLLSGEEDIARVPREMLERLVASENETISNMARAELEKLEVQIAERAKNPAPEAPVVHPKEEGDVSLIESLLSGTEDISLVPRSKLQQLSKNDNPLMREMAEKELVKIAEHLRANVETGASTQSVATPTSEARALRTAPLPSQGNGTTPTRLSGRQMEDLIESTEGARQWRNAPTTAETAFEIKQGRVMNKATIERDSSVAAPLSVEKAPSPASLESAPVETHESLSAKVALVRDALALFFGETGQAQGGHLTESGTAQLRETLVACNYSGLNEERLIAADPAYMTELEQWLRKEYDEVLLPALEQFESAASHKASVHQFTEADKMVSIESLLLFEDPIALNHERVLTPINHGVAKQFDEKFGISEGMLEGISGFNDLSKGQQLLVLKNLEQIALTDITKEAAGQQKEEWRKIPAWKRIWKQSYSFGMNPEYRTRELEKELLAKQRGSLDAGGDIESRAKVTAAHLAHIEQLVQVAADGPAVNVASDGTLEMVYLEQGIYELTPEQKKVVEEFNSAATEFAKFPREWGYQTTESGMFERWGSERRRYEAAKTRYALARANTLQLRRDKFAEEIAADPARQGEDPEKRAMLGTNLWDERVELTQLFNNHPDAEAALQQIEDQHTIAAAAKEFWKSKGMFIAGGALLRGATIALSGGIMLPAIFGVGAGVGGMIGAVEGKKLIRTRREDGRMSEEDLREEIVATNKDTGEAIVGVDGKPLKRQIKEFTDATFFIDRMDRLTEKLWNTEDADEKTLIRKKLAQTNLLMSERFERGMINFGGSSLEEGDERKGATIANRLSFMQSMAKGQISHTVNYEALEAEIERITGLRQATIEAKRKQEIIKIAAKSAAIRGTFALAGAGIAEGVQQVMHFGEPGFLGAPKESVSVDGGQSTAEIVAGKTPGGAQGGESSGASPAGAMGMEHAPGAPSYADAAPDSANPEAFNAANFDKNIADVVGRIPSAEELSVLRSTGGVDSPATANMDQHNAFIVALSKSSTPLSHEQIAAILGNVEGVSGIHTDAVAASAYEVKSGDNLTHIMREQVVALKGLIPEQQENVVQNFIRPGYLSAEEMKEIGLTDFNKIQVGQTIHLDKLNEILSHKQVGGENIIAHAQGLGGAHTPEVNPVEVIAEGTPTSIVESTPSSPQMVVPENVAELTPIQRASLWGQLSETNKSAYASEAVPRHIHEDMSKLFVKGPFEEWPKEWVYFHNRDALTLFEQPSTLALRATETPEGYLDGVLKIQRYVDEHGLTSDKGFVPRKNETLEEFLHRALTERILREGPLPWLKQ